MKEVFCMAKFRLIQRETFLEQGKYLIGSNEDGIVELDYMSSAEFEWGAIPKAYRRMMYNFSEYEVFHTGIYTPENDELMVFCKKECKEEILQSIREFIEKPYHLKQFSELEKVPKVKKDEFLGRRSNFWWCIDIKPHGDWMAFLEPQLNLFMEAIKNEYNDWWLKKKKREREKEYKEALRW